MIAFDCSGAPLYNTEGAREAMPLLDWLPHSAQQNLGQLKRILGGRKTMQSCILVTLLLTFALAQDEPETKELLGSRRKINLLNNVLHSTVRKILRPYRNKIPRTFTKNTRVHHGNQTFNRFISVRFPEPQRIFWIPTSFTHVDLY